MITFLIWYIFPIYYYIVTCGPSLTHELANTLPRRDCFLETNWLRNTVSRYTKTESCKHLEKETGAWELRHDFRDNAFIKNCNGSSEGGNHYLGRVAVIKGSEFVNSRDSDSYKSQKFIRKRRQFSNSGSEGRSETKGKFTQSTE
jgi:hypothetical protein